MRLGYLRTLGLACMIGGLFLIIGLLAPLFCVIFACSLLGLAIIGAVEFVAVEDRKLEVHWRWTR